MKKYIVELDETTSKFFEEIAEITKCPVENILANGLTKQTQIIMVKIAESFDCNII